MRGEPRGHPLSLSHLRQSEVLDPPVSDLARNAGRARTSGIQLAVYAFFPGSYMSLAAAD
jgi:predicted sugar kinase